MNHVPINQLCISNKPKSVNDLIADEEVMKETRFKRTLSHPNANEAIYYISKAQQWAEVVLFFVFILLIYLYFFYFR